MSEDKDETSSSSSSYKTKYEKLPHFLKSRLDYCNLLYLIYGHGSCVWMMEKKRVVRLMVAEGLIEDKARETYASSLEDIASSFIDELVSLGMLIKSYRYSPFYDRKTTVLNVTEPYHRLCVVDGNKKDFDARNVDSPIRLLIYAHDDAEISHHLKNLPIQSLFLVSSFYNKISQATIDTIFGLRSLSELVFTGSAVDILFNEVGEHVYLRFRSLEFYGSRNIPTPANLPNLQTLESPRLYVVAEKVLHIKTLRHLPRMNARCDNIGELSDEMFILFNLKI